MKARSLEKEALLTDLRDLYLEAVALINDYGFEYDEFGDSEDESEECLDDPDMCKLYSLMKELKRLVES